MPEHAELFQFSTPDIPRYHTLKHKRNDLFGSLCELFDAKVCTLFGVPMSGGSRFFRVRRLPIPLRVAERPAYNEDMMRKVLAIVGSAVFLVIAPGFVAGLAPWWISHWRVEAPFLGMPLFRLGGGMLIMLGAISLLDSFVRFALQGVGTPAPVFPTSHLVVTGLYRYVRNPMYVAVVITILGQGLILGNVVLLEYGGLVWLLFHVFVLIYEEPTLGANFGSEYKAFCAEVPRWIPRFTPSRSSLEV